LRGGIATGQIDHGMVDGMSGDRPWVIVLNGVGSVGKSSTVRAMQAIAARPFLHVSMDVVVAMLPERMLGHPHGLVFESGSADGPPCIAVRTGPVMARATRGMRHAVAALAAQGNDLLVDDVTFDPAEVAEYRALLAHVNLRFVGLFAPLDVLEARERERGDRVVGLARGQVDRVHRGIAYDLEIDTVMHGPRMRAGIICKAFGLATGAFHPAVHDDAP
jgi:chloramphenicol 3-O phosphotransferase